VTDKLAAVRDVWQVFVAQLPQVIMPGSDITVGEQLVPFRGKCPYRKRIPSMPDKYGIKIWLRAMQRLHIHSLKKFIWVANPGSDRAVNLGSPMLTSLVSHWLRSGYNIVTYNFFTSVSLAKKLSSKNTTLVG